MPRPTRCRRSPLPERRRRTAFELLERRELPTTGLPAFLAASGFGVTGKNSAIHADAVATDAAGDTVVTGSFRGTIAFGTSASFTSSNTQDTFVAKYSPLGALIWARTFAGQATTTTTSSTTSTTYAVGQASAVAIDPSGNVFVAGSFSGAVNFGTATAPNLLTSPANSEAFVAKLDGSGNTTWVRNAIASGGDDAVNALAIDAQGGVVLAGMFEQAATFGTTTLTSGAASASFVARYDSAGGATWAVANYGTAGSNAQAVGVAIDAAGNIGLTGFYSGTVGFSSTLHSGGYISAGSDDALVWKLNSAGQFLWVRSFGAADYDSGGGVAFDSTNDLVVVGTFSDSVNFGTSTQPSVLTAGPIFDAFVLKLDPTGQEIWAKGYVGPTGWAKGQAVVVDPFNQIHVAGAFTGPVDFDPGTATDTLTSVGSTDAYVAGLDPSGNFVYAVQAGQTNFNTALGLAVNAAGAVAVAGDYSGSIKFGSLSLPSSGLASSFVTRVQTQPTAVPSSPVLEAASTTGTTNITSITAPVFDVTTADAVNTVRLLRDGLVVAQRVGPGALTDPGPVAQGVHQYAAVQVSSAGIASLPSLASTVTFITTPPAAPTALALVAADDSGTIGDGITNVRAPRVTGNASAGVTVQLVTPAGTVLGSTTAASTGIWTFQLPSLADGSYSFQAIAIDAAANRSTPSAMFALRVLTATPPTPPAPTLLPADDSGASGDGITNVRTPRLTVAAGSGLTITLINAAGVVIGTATTSVSGVFTVPIAASLADGSYAIRAIATDVAGNASAPSPATTLVILATPPATPSAPTLLAGDDSGVVGDGLTNVAAPRFTVTAAAGLSVALVNAANQVLGSATTSVAGVYTIPVASSLADGTYVLRAVATDVAGNSSPASAATTVTISTTLPTKLAAPTLLAADDSGTQGDGMTAVRRPRITGTATPGDEVDWVNASGVVIARTTAAQGTGAYVLQPASALINNIYAVAVRQIDPYGNNGPIGPAFKLTVRATTGDYFGTSITDVAIFRKTNNTFYIWNAAQAQTYVKTFAITGDVPISGDFFGDGVGDVAVFRPSNDTFYWFDPSTNATGNQNWGTSGDVPVPGDYDGDGRTDIAVFRPSTATFYIQASGTNTYYAKPWGNVGDIPVPGDYFGNGRTDIAVFRPSNDTFYWDDLITGASGSQAWGAAGDIPVPGDYDGDGRTDLAVFRPSNDTYYALLSNGNRYTAIPWGTTGDIPVAGDYFGNGRSSWAVFNPSNQTFYAEDPLTGATLTKNWGASSADVPIQPPLTYNFNLGSGNNYRFSAITRPTSSPQTPTTAVGLILAAVAELPGSNLLDLTSPSGSTSQTKVRTATIDQAITALGLDRWRPA